MEKKTIWVPSYSLEKCLSTPTAALYRKHRSAIASIRVLFVCLFDQEVHYLLKFTVVHSVHLLQKHAILRFKSASELQLLRDFENAHRMVFVKVGVVVVVVVIGNFFSIE